ncbi:hypothetical protein C7Y47_11285 [Lysinibacillus sphaericus]|uniref:Uncharacterized protein n=1 Tax=Lysinibacillus sphaericus TaxID=1421 RepID=A0A544UK30_LYSSH|nr:hypothetical protein [Lysinibacillus sp. SDF0037]TQR33616.1 hypothetical protein C7Y47_11285 [Lysinibacillus sp. SDF0037]
MSGYPFRDLLIQKHLKKKIKLDFQFRNVIIEKYYKEGTKDKAIFIFTANEVFLSEYQSWRYLDNFRGEFSMPFPQEIRGLNKFFEEKILHYEVDVLGEGRTLIIENNYEFTLVAKYLKYKGKVTSEDLNTLQITSLRDIKSKYKGLLYLACYDNEQKEILIVLKTTLEFERG